MEENKLESINDVIYIEPPLNLWWQIKKMFGDVIHPKGYIKQEEYNKDERKFFGKIILSKQEGGKNERIQEGLKESAEFQQADSGEKA